MFFAAVLFCSHIAYSQSGPAGVGSSTNNVFWLKANAGTSSTSNGTAISYWNDQSGNSVNVSQTVTAQQPSFATNIINGFPAIQFDNNSTAGQNDKMIGPDSPLLDSTTGYSFFTVTRPQNIGGTNVVVSKRTTVSVDQSFMLFYYTSNKMFIDVETTNDRFNSVSSFTNNTNYIIDLLYDGTIANPRCSVYLQESLDVTSNETSTLVPNNASPILIGSTDAGDPRPFGGYMSELIIYRQALVPAQRIIVDNYLSAKYNISLAANDKYAGDNSGNGDYDFDVAGLGQESTGSNTSFSTSISGGLGLAVSSGFDNTDYLLAGHATPVNTVITTDVAGLSGVNKSRWQRIWYIDVTNTLTALSASVSFNLPNGGLPGTPAVASNYRLIYRATQAGTWTEIATGSSVSGSTILFGAVTFTNDGYYTIGTTDYVTSTLPVELVSFNATANGPQVDLSWITASEKNNAFFTVEKSKDGQAFENVITAKGKGSTTSRSNYQETDLHPYPGLSYYRLKQTDSDNSTSYFPLVALEFGSPGNAITIYPNPSDGLFYLDVHSNRNQDIAVVMWDESGKICFTKIYPAGTYSQIIPLHTETKLPKGNYLISTEIDTKTKTQKLIIK